MASQVKAQALKYMRSLDMDAEVHYREVARHTDNGEGNPYSISAVNRALNELVQEGRVQKIQGGLFKRVAPRRKVVVPIRQAKSARKHLADDDPAIFDSALSRLVVALAAIMAPMSQSQRQDWYTEQFDIDGPVDEVFGFHTGIRTYGRDPIGQMRAQARSSGDTMHSRLVKTPLRRKRATS
jgi:hypothetical protein